MNLRSTGRKPASAHDKDDSPFQHPIVEQRPEVGLVEPLAWGLGIVVLVGEVMWLVLR